MFVKFLVCKEFIDDAPIQSAYFVALDQFDSSEEAENYIKNYDFSSTLEVQLSIRKIYTNKN